MARILCGLDPPIRCVPRHSYPSAVDLRRYAVSLLLLCHIVSLPEHSQVFGRKLVMLGSLLIFAVGSVVCGSAKTMNALIGGRGLWLCFAVVVRGY